MGGKTYREQYNAVLNNPKASDKMKQEVGSKLEEADIPEGRELLWVVFWELFTGESLSYTEILSYLTLNSMALTEYEIELLRAMDNAGCSAVNKIRYPDKKK